MGNRYTYGFNLGHIEGLDSSVKTVTLTIANATESNTYTLAYTTEHDNDLWTDDINFENDTIRLYHYTGEEVFKLRTLFLTVSDVGDTYNVTISTSAVEENFRSAVETILADNGLISVTETLFDGTITITAEDAQGVEIPFDKDVSSYPFEKWTVTVNGLEIPYQADEDILRLEDSNIDYLVYDENGAYMLQIANTQDESYPPVPGDYQVKIVAQAGDGSGLPDVSASDNGSVLGVVNGGWVVDGRLKEYPSISNIDGGVLGLGVDREGNRIAQAIVPNPMKRTSYLNNVFHLPFKSSNNALPEYVDVQLENRENNPNSVATLILVDSTGRFRFRTPSLDLRAPGTYTLKATINDGSISFHWAKDT